MSFLVTILAISLGSSLAINGILYWLLKSSKEVQNSALETVAEISNYVGDTIKNAKENGAIESVYDAIKTNLNSEALKQIAVSVAGKNKVLTSTQKALTSLWAKGKAKINKIF